MLKKTSILKLLLAKNLKDIRKEQKISQSKLAAKSNCSLKLISEIERAMVWPRDESIIDIASALKVPASRLLLDDDLVLQRLGSALKK